MTARTASALLLSLSCLACTSTATVGHARAGMDAGSSDVPAMDAAMDAALDADAPDAPTPDAEHEAGGSPLDASDAQPDASAGCVDDDQCPTGLLCADGACVECASDADCPGPEDTRCDARGRCVECTSSEQCTISGTVCAPWGECELACMDDTQCRGSLRCDEIARVCLECVWDQDCPGADEFCDEGVCRPCALDSDCPN